MIELKFTENYSYIRIVHPDNPNWNYGYISPSDGQLSVKQEFWDMLDDSFKDDYKWIDGEGRHGGVNFKFYTDNSKSLSKMLMDLDKLFKRIQKRALFKLG